MLPFRPPRRRLPLALGLALLPALAACSIHSTATHWNVHVGPDGRPIFVLTSTYLGLHLVGLVPFVGETTIDEMVDESTRWIRAADGSRLRLVETELHNYWYGVPPLSWIFSPVITSVTFEYEPSDTALAAAGVGSATPRAEPPR